MTTEHRGTLVHASAGPQDAEVHPTDVAPRAAPPDARADVEAAIRAALQAQHFREALTLCAQHYAELLGRVSMALLGSQAEAEEVAQETLLAAYQTFPSYRAEGSLAAWLVGIARKKCLKQLEARRRQGDKQPFLPAPDSVPNAEESLQRRQRAARARAALNEMRPTEREALILRFQAELSFEDVAQLCAVDTAAARKRVSRGLARLRAVLEAAELPPERRRHDAS